MTDSSPKVSIRDVAAEAHVSVGTVSRVLNPHSSNPIRISPATREKVLSAAQRLHYAPSYGATLLRGKKTHTIGFITNLPGEFGHTGISEYQTRILNGITAKASQQDYQILLITSGDYASYLDIKRVDAMIIVNFRLESNSKRMDMLNMFRTFNERNYPYVVVNNSTTEIPIPSVSVDNAYGMKLVAEHILQQGYDSVGFVGSLTENPQHHHIVRYDTIRELLSQAHLDLAPDQCLIGANCGLPPLPSDGSYDFESGRKAIEHLHSHHRLPRCLVCGNDAVAHGVIVRALQLGLSVPEQLAVIGFDNTLGCDLWNPPLTTVNQPLEEMGGLACDMILKTLDGQEPCRQINVTPTFVSRISG